ncbi:hypothetical protein BDF19DRAFT_292259 [Syncephalis fuscata]|nr:hypothetical protein BDF19DRAFT_292259 [Syncephalis fuscata]
MERDDLSDEDIGEMVRRIFDAVPKTDDKMAVVVEDTAEVKNKTIELEVEEITSTLAQANIAKIAPDSMTHREKVMLELILLYIGILSEAVKEAETTDKSKLKSKSQKGALEPGEYDARSRAVLYYLADQIGLSLERMCQLERWIAQQLYFSREMIEAEANGSYSDESDNENDTSRSKVAAMALSLKKAVKNRNKQSRLLRWTATGTSVVIGAAALGLTGGLAAPMLAVGMGALGIVGANVIATAGGIMVVTSLFGVAGGGLAGYKTARRTGGLKEFAFIPLVDVELPLIPSLHATIVVPGYLKANTDAATPWRAPCAAHLSDRDVYALAYDTEVLQELGKAFREF